MLIQQTRPNLLSTVLELLTPLLGCLHMQLALVILLRNAVSNGNDPLWRPGPEKLLWQQVSHGLSRLCCFWLYNARDTSE